MRLLYIYVALTYLFVHGQSSKILGIFPVPSKSHYILGQSLLHGLANRGHEVTMIGHFALDKPIPNFKEVVITGVKEIMHGQQPNFVNKTWWEQTEHMFTIFPKIFHMTHSDPKLQEFVEKGEKFDLCIVSIMVAESMLGICNAVHAPAIGFSLVGLNSFVAYHSNNPTPYSYVPNGFLPMTDKMGFLERIQNALCWIGFDGIIKFVNLPFQSRLLAKYYPEAPALEELLDNVDLFLLNSHISTDSPKALLPNIIPIGGFHLQITEDIPVDLKQYLDNSKKGVIYFNMGSNMKSSDLGEETIKTFTKVFEKLEYDVLWKFEKDLPNKPTNLRIEKWLPQRSILSHPNIKLFMTHGGLGGTVESIYGAVPMICMPLFGDQGKNCADSAKNGYAIVLEIKEVTEENLLKAINNILMTPSYKEKIVLKSDLYKNQELNPMDKAIFWVEHVIRHKGAKHLKSQAANITWYQYYLLDIIGLLLVVLLTALSILYYVIKLNFKLLRCVLRKLCTKKQGNVQIKNDKTNESNKKLKLKKNK